MSCPSALSNERARVTLHVYDLGIDPAVGTANEVLRALGTGAFHAAVEVYGVEWSYGCSEESESTGVFCGKPRACREHSYREGIDMGTTALSKEQVRTLMSRLEEHWLSNDYDILNRNCTHFSDALCQELGVGSIPAWVKNLAVAGQKLERFAPHLERYWQILRPWGEFVDFQKREAADLDGRPERMQANLTYFQANYLLLTASFLILMVFDFSNAPRRSCIVFSIAGAWALFLKFRDRSWEPQVCGVVFTVTEREIFLAAGSALLIVMVIGHGVALCIVLVLVHAAMHPGRSKSSSGTYS